MADDGSILVVDALVNTSQMTVSQTSIQTTTSSPQHWLGTGSAEQTSWEHTLHFRIASGASMLFVHSGVSRLVAACSLLFTEGGG